MNQPWITNGVISSVFLGLSMALCAPAQDSRSEVKHSDTDKAVTASAKADDDAAPAVSQRGASKHSEGVDEILKMVPAGVSTEVIKLFIENSPIPYSLSATDLITLKNHAVSDDLATGMRKRGAALRSQASGAVAVPPGHRQRYQPLDPESYGYFQYYYLLPRTLAAANQRLLSSDTPGFASYPYGLSGPLPRYGRPVAIAVRPP